MQPIPMNDLGRQTAGLSREIESAIRTVVNSGWFILGPQVEAFESEFAAYCGVRSCAGVGNGTDALELALRALEIGPGDRVATVANAGGYGTTAILAAGAEPLYVDIGRDSMTLDPEALAAAMGPRVRAVIATHLYGRMCDMPSILRAAGDAPVIEDCAQAHGARLGGRAAGAWGAMGCYSFYPTKNLGALGDGGAVVTSDPALADRVRSLRQYGWTSRYRSQSARGRNSRLDEIQAAVLRVKLPHLEGWNRRRREIALSYNRLLDGVGLSTPAVNESYAAHLYVLRLRDRDVLRRSLLASSIGNDIHYPVADHLQDAARPFDWSRAEVPVSVESCSQVLTLPCFPELSDAELHAVAEAVRACRVQNTP
jgi:dTDP-4-amino-4,6-dideoxygalactose transaminase